VLRYIDYAQDPKRPLRIDFAGGPSESFRAHREAVAALYASEARLCLLRADAASLQMIVSGMEKQIELHT
jgi:hypothetical protein